MKPHTIPSLTSCPAEEIKRVLPYKARPIRVLLIESHAVDRAGLHALIESQSWLKIVAEAATCTDAIEVAANRIDVILASYDGRENSLDAIGDLLRVINGARLLVLTNSHDWEDYPRLFRAGAVGVFQKNNAPDLLIKAIEKVHAGEIWFDRTQIPKLLRHLITAREEEAKSEPPEFSTLTGREREVVALITKGFKNKQIAERLFISEPTVRHHLTSIFSKLGISDRFEMIIYAYERRMIKCLAVLLSLDTVCSGLIYTMRTLL